MPEFVRRSEAGAAIKLFNTVVRRAREAQSNARLRYKRVSLVATEFFIRNYNSLKPFCAETSEKSVAFKDCH
ncbi:hypothetical protein CWB41_11915 [Methylovirgula ligni]|nr:hypothetical protein CWB41_11915 [Methylovirgula ligni]